MSSPSTSYTLRIPKDLRRLLEAEAARTECTLAATVVNMCWMGLEVRGGGLVNCPPAKERLKGATLVPATHGQVGGNERLPPNMSALREICAGKITKEGWGFELPVGATITSSEVSICDIVMPICIVCESPMREVKGKWACADMSCGKYGVEQKPRW